MCVVEADGKKITLALKEQQIFAFAHKCPHASGVMANGFIDGLGNVVAHYTVIVFLFKTAAIPAGKGIF